MRFRIIVAVGIALLFATVVASAQQARRRDAVQSNNCGRVGTWFGQSDSGFTWMSIESPGVSATVGQVHLDWILVDPTLGGFFPTAVRVPPGLGVWEKVNQRQYKYTWVAYALDAAGQPVVVARTSGFDTITGCDRTDLEYTLELFAPAQDIWSEKPLFGAFKGTGLETRMPLVVAQ